MKYESIIWLGIKKHKKEYFIVTYFTLSRLYTIETISVIIN
jgi:hypothetical protein